MTEALSDRPSRGEMIGLLAATLLASAGAVWWSWANAAFLLYGDAEAHIHIARRLFDSHRPGIAQLGSVWLPLPHLMLAPFVAIDPWWRNGFAAVIPSAACYVLACAGLYRLARRWLSPASAWVGLALFAANPNLLYLQTTAMTEPLFLCELIWAVLLLVEWYECLDRGQDRKETTMLWAVMATLVAAVYTRYDGWVLSFVAWVAMAVCLMRRGRLVRRGFVAASLVLALAPAGWMVYNSVIFGDWLDFLRGPYSARAIELRTAASAVDPHPGWHNPWVSLMFFLEAAELDVVALGWGGWVTAAALAGTIWACIKHGRSNKPGVAQLAGMAQRSCPAVLWALLLWMPVPFYAYSVSYGSVPIFLPVWWPFSWYNTRYGMELLPALTLFFGFAMEAALQWNRMRRPLLRWAMVAVLVLLLGVNFAEMLREHPLTYWEAKRNDESRSHYNLVLAKALKELHERDPKGIVLMDTSSFPSVVPHAGLTYRQTINESDKQFYWAALSAPATRADVVLAFAGDEIDKAVKAHPEHLRLFRSFHSQYEPDAAIYLADDSPAFQTSPGHASR